MKLLPCRSQGCRNRRAAVVDYPIATLRNGDPYTLQSWGLPVATMLYKCGGCLLKTTITASEFRALPTLSLEDLRTLKLAHLVEGDLRGAGLAQAQLDQMEEAGVTVEEMVSNRE